MENKKQPTTLTWEAPSHQKHKRSIGWYLMVAIITAILIMYGVYSHSPIMIMTFCLAMFSILLFAAQQPKLVTHKLTGTGVSVGKVTYPYKIIKKFWINYNPPITKVLNLETSAYLNNQVVLQLGRQDPLEVRAFLKQFLMEDLNKEETVTDALARNLKI